MTEQQEWIVAWLTAGGIFLTVYGIVWLICKFKD